MNPPYFAINVAEELLKVLESLPCYQNSPTFVLIVLIDVLIYYTTQMFNQFLFLPHPKFQIHMEPGNSHV